VERTYAGILALVALVTAILRGWIAGADPETILFQAWLSLLVFAVIGYIVGRLAGRIVDEAVRARIASEMADREATRGPAVAKTNT